MEEKIYVTRCFKTNYKVLQHLNQRAEYWYMY